MSNYILNSGFETAGDDPGDAADWTHDSHFDGEVCGRVANPDHLPDADHAMVLGSDDLTDTFEDGTLFVTQQSNAYFRDQFLSFNWAVSTPADLEGQTWLLTCSIDSEAVWAMTCEAGDEGLSASGTALIDVSGYDDGPHILAFSAQIAGDCHFDNNLFIRERFDMWPGSHWIWREDVSTYLPFDNGAQSQETMDNWPL